LGIARDSGGNLYVADSANHTIRKITPTGSVTTLAGTAGASGSSDGTGAAARFSALKGIAVDGSGNVYAVDNSAVRKVSPIGVVTTLAGAVGELGDADGAGSTARFRRPWGIAVDGAGNVYVADTENLLVRRITPAGAVSTHAGTRGMRGRADGSTASATFLGPMGIAIDAGGNLYLTDWFGPPAPNIPEGSTFIRRIGADGSVTTLAGTMNGETGPGAFMDTFAITADGSGNVFVAALRSVRRVSATGTITGIATGSDFQSLNGIAIDGGGNLYVTDTSSHTISRVTQGGEITLVAGRNGEAGSANTP
jgi:sugar lactone lactonase YvrE